ncbi:MAG: carboxylating nicotinate-nucleotide diphosphorylase [Pseudomonadota bacterium]
MPSVPLPDLRPFRQTLVDNVHAALAEDIGDGDLTAGLVPAAQWSSGRVITREDCVLAGGPWVDEVFRQLDRRVAVVWQAREGDRVRAGSVLFRLAGPARAILSGERAALNFLQTLSATATAARRHADRVAHTRVQLLDTRKTLPGLRIAQKYAVRIGGCHNHRLGLWDAFLIKENHIAACGSIAAAVAAARRNAPGRPVEVEVESLDELQAALAAGADIVMLDDFMPAEIRTAVAVNAGRAKLEVSGGVNEATLVPLAETGVDYISIGALTKHVCAIDLSMRLDAH